MDGNNVKRYDTPSSPEVPNSPADEAHKRGLVTGLVVGIIGGGIVGGIVGAMVQGNGPTATPRQMGSAPDRNNRIYGTSPSDTGSTTGSGTVGGTPTPSGQGSGATGSGTGGTVPPGSDTSGTPR
jgi:hypothetical protein